MAYIQLNTDEFELFKKLKLPEGTTLFLSDAKLDSDGLPKYLAKYIVDANNKIQLDIDFVEKDRPFSSKEEKEDFLKPFDKVKVIDYFLIDPIERDGRRPFREYKAVSDLERKLFNHISHWGHDPHLNMGTFQLRIQRKATLDLVQEEVCLLIDRVKKGFPALDELTLGISEETCSEFGIYELLLNLKDLTGKITRTTYGRTSDLTEVLSLIDLLSYIKKNHYSNY